MERCWNLFILKIIVRFSTAIEFHSIEADTLPIILIDYHQSDFPSSFVKQYLSIFPHFV